MIAITARRPVAERGEERSRPLRSAAAEPAEELLRAVPGEQEADDEPEQQQAVLHVRLLPGQRLSNLVPVHDGGARSST